MLALVRSEIAVEMLGKASAVLFGSRESAARAHSIVSAVEANCR